MSSSDDNTTHKTADDEIRSASGHGRMRKKAADENAKAEYRQFEARRRALREVQGEDETIRALENVARDVSSRKDKHGGESKDKHGGESNA